MFVWPLGKPAAVPGINGPDELALSPDGGKDWFIFNADGPGVRDMATDLKAGEFFTDLEISFINGP